MHLDYELRIWPFPPRERQREYLRTNPLGTVPTLVDGEGTPLTESVAICQYLVARYGPTLLNVSTQEKDFGPFLNWLHFGEATLTFPQTIVLRYSRFEAPERKLSQAVSDYTRWFLSRLRAVDAAVSSRDYLCGGRFTAADVSVGYALMLASDLHLAERLTPAVVAYWQRLQSRDSFRAALQRQHDTAVAQGVSTNPSARSPTEVL